MKGIVLAIAAAVLAVPGIAVAGSANVAPPVIPIWPGQAPGTADWTGPETDMPIRIPGETPLSMIGNVTTPTLTVFKPPRNLATGAAMVVIPGGGFQMLAMDHEGYDVAKWLAARGIAAFVLKYRVHMIPGFRMPTTALSKHPQAFAEFARSFEPGRAIAIADANQAMLYLRRNAASLGIAPDRIGMMGFSAGAITTLGVILNAPAEDRPNIAAPIYGAMIDDKAPPADAPPIFLAVTQDDNAVPAEQTLQTYRRWTDAGLPAELHLFERGGHGFGMRKQGLPVDDWTVPFENWLRSHKWLTCQTKCAP